MVSLPSFLGFFLALPAASAPDKPADLAPRRRRAIQALRLSPHLLRDVGMDDYEQAANDPRWVKRHELER